MNGVLNANVNATRNASKNSVHGLARTIAQSQTAVVGKQAELQLLKDALTDLSNERTKSDVQADLDEDRWSKLRNNASKDTITAMGADMSKKHKSNSFYVPAPLGSLPCHILL